MSHQQPGPGATQRLVNLGTRPLRTYAPLMAVGAAVFAVAAILLLVQSGAGVDTFALGRPGTAISMPAVADGGEVVIYAVTTTPGEHVPDVECKLATGTHAFANFTYTGLSVTSGGRTLNPVAHVTPGWRPGDTVTCTSTSSEALVLGRNTGLTHLLQGLLCAFVALGAGTMALVGYRLPRRGLQVS
jgi:hypothetical protein